MSESESECITMTVQIRKDENPELFARLLPIHNRRTRGSVLRQLATTGLVVSSNGFKPAELVLPKPVAIEKKIEPSSTNRSSGTVHMKNLTVGIEEELSPAKFKLPVEY